MRTKVWASLILGGGHRIDDRSLPSINNVILTFFVLVKSLSYFSYV